MRAGLFFGAGAIAVAAILAGLRAAFDVDLLTAWVTVPLLVMLLSAAVVVGRRTARATLHEVDATSEIPDR